MDSSQIKVKRLLSGAESRDCMPVVERVKTKNQKEKEEVRQLKAIEERKSLDFAKVDLPSVEDDRPRSQLSIALSTRDLGGLTAVGDNFDRVSAYNMDTFTTIVYFPCFPHQEEMVEYAKVELPKSAIGSDLMAAAKKQFLKNKKDIAKANNKPVPTLEELFPTSFTWQLRAAEDDGEIDDDIPIIRPLKKVANKGIDAFAIEKVEPQTKYSTRGAADSTAYLVTETDYDDFEEKRNGNNCCSVL